MTGLPHCVHTCEDEATSKVCAFLKEKATPFDVRNMSFLYPVFSSANDILSRGSPLPPFVNMAESISLKVIQKLTLM